MTLCETLRSKIPWLSPDFIMLGFKVQTGATKPPGNKFAMQLSSFIFFLDTDEGELVTLYDDCHGSK